LKRKTKKLPINVGTTTFKSHMSVTVLMIVISLTPTISKRYKAILPFTAKSNKTIVGIIEDNKYIDVMGIIASK